MAPDRRRSVLDDAVSVSVGMIGGPSMRTAVLELVRDIRIEFPDTETPLIVSDEGEGRKFGPGLMSWALSKSSIRGKASDRGAQDADC